MDKMTALEIAIRHYGSSSALAPIIGMTPQGVSRRRRKGLDLSAEDCFKVHEHSKIPLSVLRPDLWGAEALKE